MKRDFTDAEFEVVSGPTPVRWQKVRKRQTPIHEWLFAGFFGLLALFVALIGFLGGDIDTKDEVQAWKDRQPVAATIDYRRSEATVPAR